MAYIRSLSSRAKLISRPYHLSITHFFQHHRDDIKHEQIPSVQGTNYFSPQRAFGFFQTRISCLDYPLSPGNLGVSFCRSISTSAGGDEPEKSKLMTEIADILNDTSVQVISSHSPAANEVAVAAANSFPPVAFFQHFIDAVHSFTGFNWWASIILTTLMIKGATLPIYINAVKDCRKIGLLLPHVPKELRRAEDMDLFSAVDKDFPILDEFYAVGCRLLGGMFIGASVHICFFMGILNMAEKVPSFKIGGLYWSLDLSTPDSYLIFPFLTATLILLRTEGDAKLKMIKRFSEVRKARDVWRAIAIISVPFTMNLPKAVFCYWITSELLSFALRLAIKLYGANKFFGIPDKPSENTKIDQN